MQLTDARRWQGGKTMIFQPVHLKRGTTLTVTNTKLADGSVKPGEQRAVQLIVYSSTRSDLSGEFQRFILGIATLPQAFASAADMTERVLIVADIETLLTAPHIGLHDSLDSLLH